MTIFDWLIAVAAVGVLIGIAGLWAVDMAEARRHRVRARKNAALFDQAFRQAYEREMKRKDGAA